MMKNYRVLTPILHNSIRYAVGSTISLSQAEAVSLSVHVAELPGQTGRLQKQEKREEKTQQAPIDEKTSSNESVKTDESQNETLEAPLTNAQLSELLTAQGVEHQPRAKKADLEALVATLDPEVVEAFKAALQDPAIDVNKTDEASGTTEAQNEDEGE